MSGSPATSNLEREAKLQAPAGFRLPELGGDGLVARDRERKRLVTVYVDTPDLRIVRWGCSLRHRQGEGWTVKLPSGGNGSQLVRTEVNFEGEDARKLPTAAADLLRAYVRDGRARSRRSAPNDPSGGRDHRRGRHTPGRGHRRRGVRDGRTSRGEPLPRTGGRARAGRGRRRRGRPRAAPRGGGRRPGRQRPEARASARSARRVTTRRPGARGHGGRERDPGGSAGARDLRRPAVPSRPRRSSRRRSRGRPSGEGGHATSAFGVADVPRRPRTVLGRLAARRPAVARRRPRCRSRRRGAARPHPLARAAAARERPPEPRGPPEDPRGHERRGSRASARGDAIASVREPAGGSRGRRARTAGPRGDRRRTGCDRPAPDPGRLPGST